MQAAGGRIRVEYPAVEVLDKDRGRGVLEQLPKLLLTLSQLFMGSLALGDVADDEKGQWFRFEVNPASGHMDRHGTAVLGLEEIAVTRREIRGRLTGPNDVLQASGNFRLEDIGKHHADDLLATEPCQPLERRVGLHHPEIGGLHDEEGVVGFAENGSADLLLLVGVHGDLFSAAWGFR